MSTVAVRVKRVWKYFGDFPALRDVSLEIEPGACMALLGPNGSGKTTLLRILTGLSSPSQGDVELNGLDPRSPQARANTGYLGHSIGIYDDLSAWENLRLFARLYPIADPARAAGEWLERVNLAHARDGLAREFSRGMRQRLAVARTFLHSPKLLFLDEPFTSLDASSIELLQSLLREALERGASVTLSTHQKREAMEIATHQTHLDRGQVQT